MEQWWKETKMGNLNILRKVCSIVNLSTVNPTRTGLKVSISATAGLFSAAWYSKHKDSTLRGKQFHKFL